jgi:hypothetical protein
MAKNDESVTPDSYGYVKKTLHYKHLSGTSDAGVAYDFRKMTLSRAVIADLSETLKKNPEVKGFSVTLELSAQDAQDELMAQVKSALESGDTSSLKSLVSKHEEGKARIKAWRAKRASTPVQPVSGATPTVVPADKPASQPASESEENGQQSY